MAPEDTLRFDIEKSTDTSQNQVTHGQISRQAGQHDRPSDAGLR